jgi:hypothetical protein
MTSHRYAHTSTTVTTTTASKLVWMVVALWTVSSSSFLTTVSAQCTLCTDDAAPGNLELIVPFLELPNGNSNPTCQELQEAAVTVTDGGACDLIRAHQGFCACPGASTTPVGICSLCDSSQAPAKPTATTPFGDTCQELDTYLSWLPDEQCGTERTSLIYLMDYFCGCPGSEPACPMCSDGTSNIRNGDAILPFFGNPLDGDKSTCRDVADYGFITSGGSSCDLVTNEANYCGCGDSTGVLNNCRLCPNGEDPPNGSYVTLVATCSEIDFYVSHQSAEQCASDRVQSMLQADFLCGCSGTTTTCPFCVNDGTNTIQFPDKRMPILGLPGNAQPTCLDVVNFAALTDDLLDASLCTTFQSYGGFCGCTNVEPSNTCSFCPNGGSPSQPDLQVSSEFTCATLVEFVSFMTAEVCASDDLLMIQAFAFRCGCPDTAPKCTLCGDPKVTPRNADLVLDDSGTTCTQLAEGITSYSESLCATQSSNIQAFAVECGCPGATLPQCSVVQNADGCTSALLDSTKEDCPCYAFCDGTFLGCQGLEGGVLTPQQCSGVAVAGCSRASVKGSGGPPSSVVLDTKKRMMVFSMMAMSVALVLFFV